MSPKVKKVLEVLARIFKGKEKQIPENQDALGAYPLRMQISAIPERRYLRTARILAIFTFFNLAALMVLAGMFAYYAVRQDVLVANSKVINLYAMDPEHKVIKASEYSETSYPALGLIMEQGVRDYIKSRYSYYLDPQKQAQNWGPASPLSLYTDAEKLKMFHEREAFAWTSPARQKGVNKEVHIYSLEQTSTGLWEGLIDIFDMKPRDPYHPICDCYEDTRECIECKEKNNLGRARYRVYLRSGFFGMPNLYNPLGIGVAGSYLTPQIIHPEDQFWNIPPILKPEL